MKSKMADIERPLVEEQTKKTNLVETPVLTREEVEALTKPKYPVRKAVSVGLIEQLHDRILINRSTRTVTTAIRRHWMLMTVRPWGCGCLERFVQPGEVVECHDAVDFNNLTVADASSDGPYCTVIEMVEA